MKDVDVLLVTALDEIAWILNLRGSDIEYNPVFFSYLLFYPKKKASILYINKSKVEKLADYFAQIRVTVMPYEQIEADLKTLITPVEGKEMPKIGVNTGDCNAQLSRNIKNLIVPKNNVIALIKSRKNVTEQQGMRDANIRDCAALMKYFSYLEEIL
jgi:Xaa-Pro aminopeptidase